ncbi:MAG: hypothetical protein Q4G08_02710 [Capnocytophaga sp.]|nr:hypothetical protein [Capnocytophaga sp.]
MRKFQFVGVLLLLMTISHSCINDDCTTQEVPPGRLAFNLCNKSTLQNIFVSGEYTTDELRITNMNTGANVAYSTTTLEGNTYVIISGVGATNETIRLQFELRNQPVLEYSVTAERVTVECYRVTDYKNHSFGSVAYEIEPNGAFKVLLDL